MWQADGSAITHTSLQPGIGSSTRFGYALALVSAARFNSTARDTLLLIGASNTDAGNVYLLKRSATATAGTAFTLQRNVVGGASGDRLGRSVATSAPAAFNFTAAGLASPAAALALAGMDVRALAGAPEATFAGTSSGSSQVLQHSPLCSGGVGGWVTMATLGPDAPSFELSFAERAWISGDGTVAAVYVPRGSAAALQIFEAVRAPNTTATSCTTSGGGGGGGDSGGGGGSSSNTVLLGVVFGVPAAMVVVVAILYVIRRSRESFRAVQQPSTQLASSSSGRGGHGPVGGGGANGSTVYDSFVPGRA